jgi:TonB family protein
MGRANSTANNTADIVPLDEERARRAGDDAQGDSAAPSLDTPGAMLKAARLEAGLSLDQVAAEINVKAERIEAIEAMRIAALPAAPYTLGFVRAYARLLELPAEPLGARFKEAAGYAKAGTAAAAIKAAPPPRELGASRELSLIAVLGVVGFILWCAWKIVAAMAPEEAPALPEGSPIARSGQAPRVVYEVDAAVGVATGRAAQEEVEAATLALPFPGEDPGVPVTEQPDAQEAPLSGEPAAPETADEAEAAMPSLVPLPLTLPGAPGVAEEEPDTAPATSVADLLNRQALEAAAEAEARAAETFASATADMAPAPLEEAALLEEAAPALPQPGRVSGGDGLPVRARPAPGAVPAGSAEALLLRPVAPVYPSRCEAVAGEVESVTVSFGVSRFGKVVRPQVMESTNACFHAAALSAVSRFSFEPAREEGRAVSASDLTTRVVFRRDR